MLTKEQLPRTCSRIGFKRGILMTLTKLCLTMKTVKLLDYYQESASDQIVPKPAVLKG